MPDTAAIAGPSTLDRSAYTDVTTQIVTSYLVCNTVPATEVSALIEMVHSTISELGKPSKLRVVLQKPLPPVPVRKSVTDTHIVSLEDGKPYKSLKRHLSSYGLTPDSYRAKWGLPYDYPMVAPAYARQRSALAKEMGLGNIRRKR